MRVPSLDETYPNFVVRDGNAARLERVFAKGLKGEPIVVAVIGGSITSGARASRRELQWGAVLADWFRHAFPKSEVTYVNAGIGATGSNYAVHRVEADVCAKNPDVVGVEFAVNDGDDAFATETDEGLVRHLLKCPSRPFVFQLSMMAKGCVNRMARHLPVSEHYDIPHFSYRNAFFPLISAGKLAHTDLAKDELHPDDIGQLNEESFEEIRSMANEEKCVAIGEIGLDYHWMVRPREEQKAGFIRFLELAKELDKPINVHSRDSHQQSGQYFPSVCP